MCVLNKTYDPDHYNLYAIKCQKNISKDIQNIHVKFPYMKIILKLTENSYIIE